MVMVGGGERTGAEGGGGEGKKVGDASDGRKKAHSTRGVGWLLDVPTTYAMDLKEGSAETIAHAVTLR